ncbi:MAG: 50S ribosomal protein L32 [Acidobacteriota bacterium]
MALPKKRHSRARRDRRRSQDALQLPARSVCPQCHRIKSPHRVCPHCGSYRGRTVVTSEEE